MGQQILDEEQDEMLTKSIERLFAYLIEEYMKTATTLGYELSNLASSADSK